MAYLLDADVLIRAKNLHYGFDFCPAFWDWIAAGHRGDRVRSVEKVGQEVQAGQDELARWARERGKRFFVPPTPPDLPSLRAVSDWVTAQNYFPGAIHTFLQVADYYLIGQALTGRHTVVTREIRPRRGGRSRFPTCASASTSPA